MSSVSEIVVDRLIKKIENDKKLPWQKPFLSPCMNWYSGHEYRGLNRVLLDGGEYITVNQLKKYNEAKKTKYWFDKGTPRDIVVFYSKRLRKLTNEEIDAYNNGTMESYKRKKVVTDAKGELKIDTFILNYTTVYNIVHIYDRETGDKLKPKIGDLVIERFSNVEDVISKYCENTGVRISNNGGGGAYYVPRTDSIHLPQTNYFSSTEAYYRVLFHEMVHSTGIESRLNRETLQFYGKTQHNRGREELVAELGGVLLASEVGFRCDTELAENSDAYIKSWVGWMKDNVKEVTMGVTLAEKAKEYILNGGLTEVDTTVTVERQIGEILKEGD